MAGGVILVNGNLYGTTKAGGDVDCEGGGGCGVAFGLTKAGAETVLHSFTPREGGDPFAGLIRDNSGNYYGTTYRREGTAFKLTKTGKEIVLHRFTGGRDGGDPLASLVRDQVGNLYGTTVEGGSSNNGTVFKIDMRGRETVLHNFTGGVDGANPYAGLLRDAAGNLYGTAGVGGAYLYGVVFKIRPK